MRAATRDASALRARVLKIVEDAVEQVEGVLEDAPSRKELEKTARRTGRKASKQAGIAAERTREEAVEAARRLRRTRAMEAAGAALAAAGPIAGKLARRHATRRNASRAARVVPAAVRSHPVMFGAAIAASALTGVELLRRRKAPEFGSRWLQRRSDRRQDEIATGFDLDEEVARMEGEGGDPGTFDGAPRQGGFASAGNGGRAGTR